MTPSDVAVRPRRSAFAAAFLSFLYPGLGHLYLGRWVRGLLWAIPHTLAIIGLAVFLLSTEDLVKLGGELIVDPTPLIAVLAVSVLYRLIAMLDAWRLAGDPSVGSAGTRMLSAAGLVALAVVLVGSHVVIGGAGLSANSALRLESGDDTPIPDAEDLAALPGFELVYDDPADLATASAAPDASQVAAPGEEGPVDTATEPPKARDWNGKERLNILLVGLDSGRVGQNSFLTDTMIVVSIDPTTGRVAFISLPRDMVDVPLPPGWRAPDRFPNKINTLYNIARSAPSLYPGNDKERGFNALMGALGQLYGLDIKYYVSVDLNSFRDVVTTLGGVIVDVQLPVQDVGYATEDGRGKLKVYMPPGITRMNGQRALTYARSRHGSSDYDRAARQQRVVTSVRDQTDLASLLDPDILEKLLKQVRRDVKTNIPTKLIPSLLSLAQDIDLDRRVSLVLSDGAGYGSVCYPCGPSGVWAIKPNIPRIRSAVQKVFSTSKAQARAINRLEEEAATVHVLNGYGTNNTKAIKVAGKLSQAGIDAAVPPVNEGQAETLDHRNTVITAYNSAQETMPETFKRLKRMFKDKGRDVELVDDPDQEADFVVTVGSKTKT